WVSLCQQNHANICDEQSPLVSGLRVIDCFEQRVVEAPTTLLFEYVTLSYVWGDDQQETLDPITGLPPRLPATIADAMTVTKELGFRYIWADRYCIMQHGAREKERQIKQMGQIYANSAVTIIDAAGSDMRCGLAGVSYDRRSQPRIRVGSHHFASVLSSAYQDIELSRWATRGWTYQEGRMARRRLVFTAQQAYFQCGDMHCIE
ncbi:HET-domain-containing protein, partial [Thozetella sp. PMI_491]